MTKLSEAINESVDYRIEQITEGEAAEFLLDESLKLIGKAEFQLWQCKDKGCPSCVSDRQYVLRLKEDCERLQELVSSTDEATYSSPIKLGDYKNIHDALSEASARLFPDLNPHRASAR